jgi:hypothetical protein
MSSLILERNTPETGKRTRIERDPESGCVLIRSIQDTDPIVDDCKRMATARDRHEISAASRRGGVMVANIPIVMWLQLVRLGITRDEKALRKWLSRRDTRHLRTDDGRSLI